LATRALLPAAFAASFRSDAGGLKRAAAVVVVVALQPPASPSHPQDSRQTPFVAIMGLREAFLPQVRLRRILDADRRVRSSGPAEIGAARAGLAEPGSEAESSLSALVS
jgi:hypothetical protein